MKKRTIAFLLMLALALSLAACGIVPSDESKTPAVEPPTEALETAEPRTEAGRQAAEGFGRRFNAMMHTLSVIEKDAPRRLTDEEALSAVRNYCLSSDPSLESIVESGDYPVYWEIVSSDESEIVVLYRSYTGAQIRYYIDRVMGSASVTEFVPGIMDEEQPTAERFFAWDHLD